MLFVDARRRTADIDLSVGFAMIEAMKHVSHIEIPAWLLFFLRLP
jgi:hypothetical protein